MNRIATAALAFLLLSSGIAFADAPATDDQIKKLIDQLGADDYATREQATSKLLSIGKAALPLLKEALTRQDMEIVSRARVLLSRIGTSRLPGGPISPDQPFVPDEVSLSMVDGERIIGIRQGERAVRLRVGPNGIVMTVSGPLDGQPATREFVAHDGEQLRRENPEAYTLYDKCIAASEDQAPEARVRRPARVRMVLQQGLIMGPVNAPDELDLLRVRLEGQMRRANVKDNDRTQLMAAIDKLADLRNGHDMEAYAAKSDEMRKQLDDLKLDAGDLLPPPARTRLGVSLGTDGVGQMVVQRVLDQSRAQRLGLKAGDVVQSVDGHEVKSVAALRRAVVEKEKGLVVEITREGAEMKLEEK